MFIILLQVKILNAPAKTKLYKYVITPKYNLT